jgi:hypothetical protein
MEAVFTIEIVCLGLEGVAFAVTMVTSEQQGFAILLSGNE